MPDGWGGGGGGQGGESPGVMGREGCGRREEKGWEAGSLRGREAGEKFKRGSVRYLLLLITQSKKQQDAVTGIYA